MTYEEFKSLKIIPDKENPFSTLFEYPDGARFYMEPIFYSQLRGFKELHPNEYPLIINGLEETVHKNKRVVFTGDYFAPSTNAKGYIYLEITDITDPLNIFVEDKSRGSDYGD